MAEWLKAPAWKACILLRYQGFESLSLRQSFTMRKSIKYKKMQNIIDTVFQNIINYFIIKKNINYIKFFFLSKNLIK